MAATVEGTFILVDRASGPARRIKTELRELELQARRTGRAMDDVGSPKQARTLDQTARETRVLGQEARGAGREEEYLGQRVEQTSTRMRRQEQDTKRLGQRFKELAVGIRAVKEVMGLLKWPAMIAGAGGLTQVVGGLTTGVLGLLPRLTDLAGTGASLIPLYAGVGGAMLSVKLATGGLSQALAGNQRALKALTPEGRAFLQVLKSYTPELNRMRGAAQRGLFPGLERALTQARRDMPALRRILQQSGADVGNLASFGVGQLNARGGSQMRELVTLSDEGGRALGAAARSAFYLGEGLAHVGVAAAPFTDWLGNTVERLAKMAEHELRVRQETGQLGRFFDRTKESLKIMGDTGEHVFHGVLEVLRAARGEGDSMWKSIDHGAASFDKWAGSFKGQNEMRRFFSDTRPVLDETVGLVGDLGKALGGLMQGGEGVQMVQALRAAVPDLARGIRAITSGLGPGIISGLGSFVKLIADASGNGGALSEFVGFLGTAIRLVDGLVRALGPLGPAITTAIGGTLLARRLGVLKALEGGWRKVAGAERGAAADARAYASTPTGTAPSVAFGPGGMAGGGAAPGVAFAPGAAAGESVSAGGVILPAGPAAREAEAAAARTGGAGLIARGRAGVSGAWSRFTTPTETNLLRTGGGAALRTLGPAALLMGVMGAAQQGYSFSQRAQAFASLGGINPFVSMPTTPAQNRSEGAQAAGEILSSLPQGSGMHAQRGGIAQLRQLVSGPGAGGMLGDRLTALGYRADPGQMGQATAALKQELDRRVKLLRESARAAKDALNTQSVDHANTLMRDFGRAFDIRSKKDGPVAAMDTTVKGVLSKMRSMRPAGARVLGENVIAWARQQARSNPALLGEVKKLETGITRSFSRTRDRVFIVNGQILDGTAREWAGIREALTTQTEKAREEVSGDFTAIQQEAVGSLRAMGFSPGQASNLVQSIEQGGRAGKTAKTAISTRGTAGGIGNLASGAATASLAGTAKNAGVSNATGDGLGMETAIGGPAPEDRSARTRARSTTASNAGNTLASQTSGGLMGAKPGLGVYAAKGEQFGLHVSSGRRPGAITVSGNVSYHSSGDAIDMSGSPAAMLSFARYAHDHWGPHLEELIHTPLGREQIKNGQPFVYTGAVAAGHYDHVHVADTQPTTDGSGGISSIAGGGMGGTGHVSLRGRRSRNRGLPGALVEASTGLYAAGLEKKINAALGGGAMLTDNTAGAVGGGSIAQMISSVGLPPIFRSIVSAESGGNPHAHNPSGATGLLQIMMPLHAALVARAAAMVGRPANVEDPLVNLMTGKLLYEQGGLSPWTASRGVWGRNAGDGLGWGGWHANGGDFHASRPTLFGAGERADGRPERVTITPQAHGPRMTRPTFRGPMIESGAIRIHAPGADAREVARLVGRHLEDFADMVREELAGGEDLADAEAVIG